MSPRRHRAAPALAAGLALALFASTAQTQQRKVEPDVAFAAFQNGYFLSAFKEATLRLEKSADDAAAMTLLGELYRQGLGVRRDPARATEWYRLAFERGDLNAQHAYAAALIAGSGTAKDEARGVALMEQAADKGQPEAAYSLALRKLASGTDADLPRAIALLRIATDAEIGEAQHALGVLVKTGRGIAADPDIAADLMRRAASNGSLAGEVELAIMTFNGNGTGRDERAAARLFQRAAAKGNAIAQNRLARLYASGRGLPLNPVEAVGWHLAAKAQGLGDATLERVLDQLSGADRARALDLAASRIESNALTRAR